MPRITTIRNLRIYMYANDHPPPHVHVHSPEFSVRIALQTLAPIDLVPKGHDLRDVIDYLRQRQTALLLRWSQLNEADP